MLKKLLIENLELSYRRNSVNSPARFNILFIHGNSSSSNVFEHQLKNSDLCKIANMVAIDLPGHGNSSHVNKDVTESTYTISFYSQIIKKFIEQLGFNEPILIGHSLGAHITTALTKTIKTKGLLNIQNTPIDTSEDLSKALSSSEDFQQLFIADIDETKLRKLASCFFMGKPDQSFFEDFKKTDPMCRQNLTASITKGLTLNEINFIKQKTIPYKLLIAKNDGFTKINYIKSLGLKESVSFLDCAHYPMIESKEQVNMIILDFIKTLKL